MSDFDAIMALLKGREVSTPINRIALDPTEDITVIAPEIRRTADCIAAKCESCQRVVWLAPTTQTMMAESQERSIFIFCIPCAKKELEMRKEPIR